MRRLRRLGRWDATGWRYDDERGEAIKSFTWDADVIAKAIGDIVALHYFTRASVAVQDLENLGVVDAAERQARDLLALAVERATTGIGYIPAVAPGDFVARAVGKLLGRWLTTRSPEDWQQQLRAAVDDGLRAFDAAAARAHDLGAEPEVEEPLRCFGCRIPIRPLTASPRDETSDGIPAASRSASSERPCR
jgi:hypothetical protein